MFGRRKTDRLLPLALMIQIIMLLVLYGVDLLYLAKLSATYETIDATSKRMQQSASDFDAFLFKLGFRK